MQMPTDIEFRQYVTDACKKFDKTPFQIGGLAEYTNLKNYMDGINKSIPLASAHKVKGAIDRLEAENPA